MKDMLRVDVMVDDRQFREATGLVRFDDDPEGNFFALIDSKIGALNDEITLAVREVLKRAHSGVEWEVQVLTWKTPMTERGRFERAQEGLPVPKGGRKPAQAAKR